MTDGDRATDAWAMAVPSRETLDFLGQLVTESPSTALTTLAGLGRQYRALTSELALAYALDAARRGYPHQSLVGVQLAEARLDEWRFGSGGSGPLLSMAGANLAGAALRRARFDRVDLTKADLSGTDLTVTEFPRVAAGGYEAGTSALCGDDRAYVRDRRASAGRG